MYGGFVDLRSEDPAAGRAAWSRPSCPELNNGPHFFYGLQWWFFGVLAVFGFCYLAYDEWRKRPGGSRHQREPAEADQDANASAKRHTKRSPDDHVVRRQRPTA